MGCYIENELNLFVKNTLWLHKNVQTAKFHRQVIICAIRFDHVKSTACQIPYEWEEMVNLQNSKKMVLWKKAHIQPIFPMFKLNVCQPILSMGQRVNKTSSKNKQNSEHLRIQSYLVNCSDSNIKDRSATDNVWYDSVSQSPTVWCLRRLHDGFLSVFALV